MKQILITLLMALLVVSSVAAIQPDLPIKTKSNNMFVEIGPPTLADELFRLFSSPQAVRGLQASYAPGDIMSVTQYYDYNPLFGGTGFQLATACTASGQEYTNHPDGGVVYLTFEVYSDDKDHQTASTLVDWFDKPYEIADAGILQEFRANLDYLIPSSAIPGDTWSLSSYIKCDAVGQPNYEITGIFQSWGPDELNFDIEEGFVYQRLDHYGCYEPPPGGLLPAGIYWYDNLDARQDLVAACPSGTECELNGPLDGDCVSTCTDTEFTPLPSQVCEGLTFTQTMCELSRDVFGEKTSGIDIYNNNCDTLRCGNGVRDSDEQCDGTINAPTNGFCTSSCLIACDAGYSLVKTPTTSLSIVDGELWTCVIDSELMCGNGELNYPEECDTALPDPANGVCEEGDLFHQACTINCNSGYDLKLVNNALVCVADTGNGDQNQTTGDCEDGYFHAGWFDFIGAGFVLDDFEGVGSGCFKKKIPLSLSEVKKYNVEEEDFSKGIFNDPKNPFCFKGKAMCGGERGYCVYPDGESRATAEEKAVHEALEAEFGGLDVDWHWVWDKILTAGLFGSSFDWENDVGMCVNDPYTATELIEKYSSWWEENLGVEPTTAKIIGFLIAPLAIIFLLNFLLSPRRR